MEIAVYVRLLLQLRSVKTKSELDGTLNVRFFRFVSGPHIPRRSDGHGGRFACRDGRTMAARRIFTTDSDFIVYRLANGRALHMFP